MAAIYRPAALLGLLFLLAAPLPAGDAAAKQPVAIEPPARPLHGALSHYQGLRVLELWGSPEQAGFAHGYLLADDIVRLFDEYLLDPSIIPQPAIYELQLRNMVRQLFDWPDEARAELRGVLEGIHARLTPEQRIVRALDRELDEVDLLAANAFADLWGLMCSSVSVWGTRTSDGRLLTARNLDFPFTPPMARAQVVVVRHGWKNSTGYVSVSWPAMIGVYTALSERGVAMLMHDASGLTPAHSSGFTPRSWILREALVAARPPSFISDVRAVFERRRVVVGNNIHVSSRERENGFPAVVFEYDAGAEGSGVTLRTPGGDTVRFPDALFNTNHMCVRKPARDCRRFAAFQELLTEDRERGRPLEPARLFEILHAVRQHTTLHSVVIEPAAGRMHVRIAALSEAPVAFELADWLGGRLADARALVESPAGQP